MRVQTIILAVIALVTSQATHIRERRQYSNGDNAAYSRDSSDLPSLPSQYTSIKRCVNIHQLANGQTSCAYSGCRLRCLRGYHFIGTESNRKITLSCDHRSGELYFRGEKWSPEMTMCSPSCTNTCQNGGTCSAPDTCSCQSGYTGKFCETERMLGDSPYGGYQLADLAENQRRVECPDGTRMPDGSTSVTMTYKDGHYFYPDGRVLLGVDQVTCSQGKAVSTVPRKPLPSGKPYPSATSRPLPLIQPTPSYVTKAPSKPEYTCTPACANGGKCVQGNSCVCARGFWGKRCFTRVCTYPRFESDLRASLGGTLLRLRFECNPGLTTAAGRDSVVVLCREGYWRLPNGKLMAENDVKCY